MAYEALYTRTRPRFLSQLVGQDHISVPLTRAINLDRLAHAYLLVGTRGTGKTSTARLMARAVNCDAVVAARADHRTLASSDIPCGKCDACRNFDRSPDNVEFDAASNRSVEDISRLLSTVYLAPLQARIKTFIIDEVHMLSFEAVNSILKLIEEPPDNVIFFLATTEYNKVPLTIRSRCQILNFKLIAQDRIANYIVRLGALLKVEIDADAAKKIARLARGSMRDALTLLDQCYSMIGGEKLTLELVDETLGLVADSDLDDLIDAIRSKDRSKISMLNAKVLASGITAIDFAEEIITHARDRITQLDNSQSDDFQFFARLIDLLRKAAVEMRASGIADIILETTLLKLASDAIYEPVANTRPSDRSNNPSNNQSTDRSNNRSTDRSNNPSNDQSTAQSNSQSNDPMNGLRDELSKNADTPERITGGRIIAVLKRYFSDGKNDNIKTALENVAAADFDGNQLNLTFRVHFDCKSFDATYRQIFEDAVCRLLEKKIEVATRSLEPAPATKKDTASTIARAKPKRRGLMLKVVGLFGDDVEIEDRGD